VRLLVRALAAQDVDPLQYRRRNRPLLVRACEEKLDEALERIARLLAMVYPPHDIRSAHRALRGSSASARAGAIELLDNLVEGSVKGELLAALDDVALGDRRRAARADRAQALGALLTTDDRWLRTCAAYAAEAADAAAEPALALELEGVPC
jgi:hypothetical protein